MIATATKISSNKRHALKQNCQVCDCSEARFLFRQEFSGFSDGNLLDGYDVVVCRECGFAFADDLPEQQEFDRYYGEMSKYEFGQSEGKQSPYDLQRFSQIFNLLAPRFPDKEIRILDIGCSTGGQLAEFKKKGYRNLLGVDPSPACAKAARNLYGIEVHTSTISGLKLAPHSFDLILLVGVLEHVCTLGPVLEKIKGLLAPGGKLYLEVPDALRFDVFEDAPFQEFSTEHIIFFSTRSLENLLVTQGFGKVWDEQNDRRYSSSTIMPNISALFDNPGNFQGNVVPDDISLIALQSYINTSKNVERRIIETIDRLVESKTPILVWGVGTHTQRLLESTSFADLNIKAFIDSNARYYGKKMNKTPIIGPDDLNNHGEAVLISSRVFQPEIEAEIIRATSGKREIVKLYNL